LDCENCPGLRKTPGSFFLVWLEKGIEVKNAQPFKYIWKNFNMHEKIVF
jgi:hypothetical protein